MKQLFANYSVGQILIFIIIAAIAIKEFFTFIDWVQTRSRAAVKEKDLPIQHAKVIQKHGQELDNIKTQLDSLKDNINLLLASDRDDIKQSLTKDHHYFCYKLGSIDDYSLDCMEKRYAHYQEEGGNTFISTLMEEVRALPRKLETNNR